MFHKKMCGSFTPTLKSKINILYFEEFKSNKLLSVSRWFFIMVLLDYRNNLSSTVHSIGLVLFLEDLKEYLPLCIT